MYQFKIVTNTTADLPQEYLEKNDLGMLSFSYTIKGENYGGMTGRELDWKEFYSMVREGNMPKTSQVNPEEYKAYFSEVIKETKEILYIGFSSGLSGSTNSARIAAQEIMDENSDVTIRVPETETYKVQEYHLPVYHYLCAEVERVLFA